MIRSWFADQPRLCGATSFAPARKLALVGSDGIALRVRGPIETVEQIRWPKRVALLARVGHLSIATTHLENRESVARAQLDELLDRFAAWPKPRVLLGDLNLTTGDVRDRLQAGGLAVVDGAPSEPAWAPHHRIDHVAVDGLTVTSERTIELPVSDHRAVVVEVVE